MTLYGAALLVLLGGGVAALAASRSPRLALLLGSSGAGLGGALGLAAVVPFLLGAPAASLRIPWATPFGAFHIRLDALSAFFQAALFALSIPAAVYGTGHMRSFLDRRSLPAFVFFFDLLVASISVVLSAADGVLFLVVGEVMTVATFVLVTFEGEQAEVPLRGRLP